MHIGESFVGSGPNAAHINVLIGPRQGPVGQALANSLAAPRLGYIPFMTCLKPNVPVKPATLFVAKADLRGETHENMTWGPAQAGVAKGVQECLLERVGRCGGRLGELERRQRARGVRQQPPRHPRSHCPRHAQSA